MGHPQSIWGAGMIKNLNADNCGIPLKPKEGLNGAP